MASGCIKGAKRIERQVQGNDGQMVTINTSIVRDYTGGERGEVMFAEPNRDNQWRIMVHQANGGRSMFWIRRGYLTPEEA